MHKKQYYAELVRRLKPGDTTQFWREVVEVD
jgi:hypothetical protein